MHLGAMQCENSREHSAAASTSKSLSCMRLFLCSPFGSRVAERLLERLGQLLDNAPDQHSADRLYEVPPCYSTLHLTL